MLERRNSIANALELHFLALTHRVAFWESLLVDVQAPFGLQGINHYTFFLRIWSDHSTANLLV